MKEFYHLPIVTNQKTWEAKLKVAKKTQLVDRAQDVCLTVKPHGIELLNYFYRAKQLQEANLGLTKRKSCGDRLQDSIPIYDTVQRRYAGFSNVLEQLWYGPKAPKYVQNNLASRAYPRFLGTPIEWLYLCLVHRMTGSGASFERDHGWRNTIVPQIALRQNLTDMAKYAREHPGPSGTSIGNQFPAVQKISWERLEQVNARNSLQFYLGVAGPLLVQKFDHWVRAQQRPVTVKQTVDHALEINASFGEKNFHFQLTAWAMDIGEYLPELVDPGSDCYHGKNAQEAVNLCFSPRIKMKPQEVLDRSTRVLCDITGVYPYDMEDVFCDFIRWVENYVPKHGYQHVIDQKIFNSSSLKHHKGRQP